MLTHHSLSETLFSSCSSVFTLQCASKPNTAVMAAHEYGHAADEPRDSHDSDADSQHSTERYDQETLNMEEEAERLLMGVQGQRGQSKSKRRKGRQDKWRGSRDGDASELMLKIEEGGRSSDDSANSSDVDARELKTQKVCVDSNHISTVFGVTDEGIYIVHLEVGQVRQIHSTSHHHTRCFRCVRIWRIQSIAFADKINTFVCREDVVQWYTRFRAYDNFDFTRWISC